MLPISLRVSHQIAMKQILKKHAQQMMNNQWQEQISFKEAENIRYFKQGQP